MALPMLLGGLGRLGLGAAMSPLQGLGFGFGYGYGVRLGYHSFKPSKSEKTTAMRLSPNPVTASVGMGLGTAEERTGKALTNAPISGMSHQPNPLPTPKTPPVQTKKVLTHDEKLKKHGLIESNDGSVTIKKSRLRTHEEYVAFKKYNKIPNSNKSGWY